MFYIFESIEQNGSRKRLIYERFRPAFHHFLKFKKIPRVCRNIK